jgi:hypothetical protein
VTAPLEAQLLLHRKPIVRYSVRNMSTLWSSLISAGAGLLGAVLGAAIGVLGALRASREASQATLRASREASEQASETAIEQVLFAVRYERKAQVMATAYDKVGIARDKLALLAHIPRPEEDLWGRSFDAYWKSSEDARSYLERNAVWNDSQVDADLGRVLQRCNDSLAQFEQAWILGPGRQEFNEGKKDFAVSIKGGGDRVGVSGELEFIGHNMRRILELEKPQRG